MLDQEIIKYIDKSVLCWLATSSADNIPNVSPKEAFAAFENKSIIIANIASPQSVKNIKENNAVCISFIDIFVQKGFQLKGRATIIDKGHADFTAMEKILLDIVGDKFPFASITNISVEKVKRIIAPSYILYPETTEADQIQNARKAYQIEE